MVYHGGDTFFQGSCIDFSAAVNFLGAPESVMQAARSGLVAAVQYAREISGTLNEHVAAWEGVYPWQVFCRGSVSEVFQSLVKVLKPKKALLPAPGFEEYLRVLSMVKCSASYYYTKEEEGFCIQQEDFIRQITEDIDLVFLCNPANPAAVLYDKPFITAVLQRCGQMGAVLILDECLLDFVEHADRFTMCAKDAEEPLFIIKTFTNLFAMPGIRLGYGICTNRELMEKLAASVRSWNVSAVAVKAGIACTKEREFVEKTARAVAAERDFLLKQLEDAGIKGAKGAANFIFFKSRPGLHAFGIMHGILLRDCSNFEGLPEGCYRVTVRSRLDNEKLIDVLKQWQQDG